MPAPLPVCSQTNIGTLTRDIHYTPHGGRPLRTKGILRRPWVLSPPVLAGIATAVLVLATCTARDGQSTGASGPGSPASGPSAVVPSTTTAPTAPSSPQPPSVEGKLSVRLMQVSNQPVVFGGDGPPTDNRYVENLVRRTGTWLNAHLTDLARGGRGRLKAVAAAGLLANTSSTARYAVTGGLVPDGATVADARFEMLVAVDQLPQWVRVNAIVTTDDGGEHAAQFVFAPAQPRPKLLAAGPVDPANPPQPPTAGDGQ